MKKLTHPMRMFIRKALRALGYHLVSSNGFHSMNDLLANAANLTHDIQTIVDIGASDGRWTKECMQHFPNANYLLMEANSIHRPALQSFCDRYSNVSFSLSVAGREEGQVYFDLTDPFGGIASFDARPESEMLPMTTIDGEMSRRALQSPYLLKFDTHGFEIPIIDGASETLSKTQVIIMEAYNFQLSHECLKFWEMCAFLDKEGFAPIDLGDPMFRPGDSVLWQMDLMFVRKEHPRLQMNKYST